MLILILDVFEEHLESTLEVNCSQCQHSALIITNNNHVNLSTDLSPALL